MATPAEQFQASFTKFTRSTVFNSTLEKLNLYNIKFEILCNKHAMEAIDILSKQFSISGGGHRARLFNCKSTDLCQYFILSFNKSKIFGQCLYVR